VVVRALVSRRAFVVAKHRAVEGAAAVVRLGALGVVASAKREVGAPRSGAVVVVVHSATGGVADVAPTERARRAEVVHLVHPWKQRPLPPGHGSRPGLAVG
jgi:hypothetical protein